MKYKSSLQYINDTLTKESDIPLMPDRRVVGVAVPSTVHGSFWLFVDDSPDGCLELRARVT